MTTYDAEPSFTGEGGITMPETDNRRKFAIGLGALGAVAAVVIALVAFVLPGLEPTADDLATATESVTPGDADDNDALTLESDAQPVDAKPLTSSFSFRDIFEPTVKPTKTADSTSGGTSSGGTNTGTNSGTSTGGTNTGGSGSTSTPSNTLELKSVTTENGEPVATFTWNGKTYTAGAGDALEGTSWKVVSISGETVVMLYGDSQISLTVGQGITK